MKATFTIPYLSAKDPITGVREKRYAQVEGHVEWVPHNGEMTAFLRHRPLFSSYARGHWVFAELTTGNKVSEGGGVQDLIRLLGLLKPGQMESAAMSYPALNPLPIPPKRVALLGVAKWQASRVVQAATLPS
jgi:hypothetical protein